MVPSTTEALEHKRTIGRRFTRRTAKVSVKSKTRVPMPTMIRVGTIRVIHTQVAGSSVVGPLVRRRETHETIRTSAKDRRNSRPRCVVMTIMEMVERVVMTAIFRRETSSCESRAQCRWRWTTSMKTTTMIATRIATITRRLLKTQRRKRGR